VIPFRISLIEGYCQPIRYWTKGSFWWSWSHHFENFTVVTMTWLTFMEYLCHKWPWICPTVSTSRYFTHSRFNTGFVARLTLRMSLVG
jgi:hypothetical protein